MNKLTKEQAIILTGFTGILCCNFSDFHKDVEKRLGRAVFTHEFATLDLKEVYKSDFSKLIGEREKWMKI